jgi:hypothetical protein
MLLPKTYIDQVSYWEERTYTPWYTHLPKTVVLIHFKQWYKIRKSFTFDWSVHDVAGSMYTFIQPHSASELINQLRKELS